MKQVNSTPPSHDLKLIPLFLLASCLGISLDTTQVQAQPSIDTLGSPTPLAIPKPASRTVEPDTSPTPSTAASASSGDASSTYIDRTDYSIGATQPERAPASGKYTQPSAVVLSERRTGRRTVLQPGQRVTGNLFSSAPASNRTATPALRGMSRVVTQARSFPGSRPASLASSAKAGFSGTMSVAPGKIGPFSLSKAIPLETSGLKISPEKWLPDGAQLTFPLPIPVAITSAFGWRVHPITGAQRFHSGTDLGAPMGTPVLAAYKGKVAIANFLGGYGLSIVLEHQDDRATRYAHLSQVLVQPGAWVEQGRIIGRVGSTGNSTGPHLHFELLQATPEGWIATDPSTPLEFALAQLVQALQTAQARPRAGT